MSEARSRGLGRGLSSLLGDTPRQVEAAAAEAGAVREIAMEKIRAHPDQPRRLFADGAIAELAESIGQRGVLQPILVRRVEDGFEIVAGERRWRASQRAGLATIPAIVREFDSATTAEVALIENIQREDLSPLEEAGAYRRLIDIHRHTQEGVSKLVHKSRSHVANLLRLLDLPPGVRDRLESGALSMGAARALIGVADAEAIATEAVENDWNVRQIEQRVRQGPGETAATTAPRKGNVQRSRKAGAADADLLVLERQLGDLMGLKVTIAAKGSAGSVQLHFATLDQLDLICQRLSGEPI
jgi:ParB family transcriptional regulator, chromosome partitioning protein